MASGRPYSNLLWSLITKQPLEEGGKSVDLKEWDEKDKTYSFLHLLKDVYDSTTSTYVRNMAQLGVVATNVSYKQSEAWLLLLPPIVASYWQGFVDYTFATDVKVKNSVYVSPMFPASKISSGDIVFQVVNITKGGKKIPVENEKNADFFKQIINKPDSGYFYVTVALQVQSTNDLNVDAMSENFTYDVAKKISDALKRPDVSQNVTSTPATTKPNLAIKKQLYKSEYGKPFKALHAKRMLIGSIPLKFHLTAGLPEFDPRTVNMRQIEENLECIRGNCQVPQGKAIGFLDSIPTKQSSSLVNCDQTKEGMLRLAEKHNVAVTQDMTKDDICAAVRRYLIQRREKTLVR